MYIEVDRLIHEGGAMSCTHRYRKFNEALLFCTRCGITKAVYSPGWTYTWRPYITQPWITMPYWSTGATSPNVTYTSWNSLTGGLTNAEGREVPGSTAEPEGHEDD
jgi:hypothetical protein